MCTLLAAPRYPWAVMSPFLGRHVPSCRLSFSHSRRSLPIMSYASSFNPVALFVSRAACVIATPERVRLS